MPSAAQAIAVQLARSRGPAYTSRRARCCNGRRVALYVGVQAVRAVIDRSHPQPSAFAFGIAAASLVVLPVLGAMKVRLGRQRKSPALRGDGVLTAAAAALAAITLLALSANSLLDWWWADPVAALVIATALAAEATRVAVRHRFG
jgi:divalent metal cation (Fe/Co/Zn/Cd) transporter